MIKRIYIKLLAYLDQLLGLLHFYLEKYNFTELIVFQEVNKKNDVIQISNSYPINYKEKDKISMQEISELAGGRYIPINKLVDARNNLKEEIRFICFKK